MNLSNELTASVFFTNPEIPLTPASTPDVSLSAWNSLNIALDIAGTSGTLAVGVAPGLTLLSIPRDTKISDLLLQSVLLV